jgi:Zn-dependent protease with chaperone function
MRGLLGLILLSIVVVALAGCASPVAQSPAWSNWADREGGLTCGQECARASAALERLGDTHLDTPSHPLCVRVLNSDRPCAYCWPDGTLFVTKGLLQLLDDDELTGALAHEVGHLCGGSAQVRSAAFSGNGGTDCEVRADAAGCELLQHAGLSPDFLAHALLKVRDDPRTPASLSAALWQRVQIIQRGEASQWQPINPVH